MRATSTAKMIFFFYTNHLLPDFFSFFFALKVLYTAESQQLSYVVRGLKPYSIYDFTISLCNSVGCVTSAPGTGQTLAAGKQVSMHMNYIYRVFAHRLLRSSPASPVGTWYLSSVLSPAPSVTALATYLDILTQENELKLHRQSWVTAVS